MTSSSPLQAETMLDLSIEQSDTEPLIEKEDIENYDDESSMQSDKMKFGPFEAIYIEENAELQKNLEGHQIKEEPCDDEFLEEGLNELEGESWECAPRESVEERLIQVKLEADDEVSVGEENADFISYNKEDVTERKLNELKSLSDALNPERRDPDFEDRSREICSLFSLSGRNFNHHLFTTENSLESEGELPKSGSTSAIYRMKLYKCDECSYRASLEADLRKHVLIHCSSDNSYKCDYCPFIASQKSYLFKHFRIHAEEKPFRCDICPYRASRKQYLSRHMQSHVDVKPYKCEGCPYTTFMKHDLAIHARMHTGEKPFVCDQCPYRAAQNKYLIRHKKTHLEDKPYKCEKCSYNSTRKQDLIKHLRTHTNEKPYQCTICPYNASLKHHLVRHLNKHTGEKPFKCGVCSYNASLKQHLVRHLRTHASR